LSWAEAKIDENLVLEVVGVERIRRRRR